MAYLLNILKLTTSALIKNDQHRRSFIFCDIRYFLFWNIMKKWVVRKNEPLQGKGTSVKSLPRFFYLQRPVEQKKHEWLVNSKMSSGTHYRARTIKQKLKNLEYHSHYENTWDSDGKPKGKTNVDFLWWRHTIGGKHV